MRKLSFKTKIILLVLLPLVATNGAVIVTSLGLMKSFGDENISSIQRHLTGVRENELANYTALALSAVKHLYSRVDNEGEAREQAKEVLRNLAFGNDGYFFVYDYLGTNVAHPKKPELEGRNLIELTDPKGVRVIDELIQAARKGGDTVNYVWDKPSLGRDVDKIGYAASLDRWRWMVGTGLYTDDIEAAESSLKTELKDNMLLSLGLLSAISIGVVLVVGGLTSRITLSEGKLADKNLQLLNRRYRDVQEEVRSRISNEILRKIKTPLESLADNHSLVGNPLVRRELSDVSVMASEISHSLRPSTLDEGLFVAIEHMITFHGEDRDNEIIYELPDKSIRLPVDLETKLFRVTEELLINGLKHAGADTIQLRLMIEGDKLQLHYQDNGKGFSVRQNGADDAVGFGMRSVTEQIESEHGTLSIHSTKNVGTVVRASVPIPAE